MSLACVTQGRGRPLVLLHAFPLSGLMWQEQIGRLAQSWRVVVPDLPGFGHSPRLPEPSIEGYAHAVWGLLDSMGLREPAAVTGLSMGGYVAFEMLRATPARVAALGLLSTRAAPDSPEQRQGRTKLIERIRQDGFEAVAPTLAPKLLGRTTHESRAAAVEQVTALIRRATADGVIDALTAMATRRDSAPLLAAIRCPALVMAGEEDAIIPVDESAAMAAAIPGCRFERIQRAGHIVNLEDPPAFDAALDRFLGPLRAPPP